MVSLDLKVIAQMLIEHSTARIQIGTRALGYRNDKAKFVVYDISQFEGQTCYTDIEKAWEDLVNG